jgi:hypothetical protein
MEISIAPVIPPMAMISMMVNGILTNKSVEEGRNLLVAGLC